MIKNDRILIVDDVVDNIRIAMNILKEDNYDFSFAHSGVEALELLREEPEQFQLILLDIMMPGIDGFETCEEIKANPATKDIPIIFLTAKTDVDSISKGFVQGAVDYITKPFFANELLARVKTHIELYRAKELLKYHNILLENKAKYEKIRLLTELEDNQKEMIYILTELMESTSDETGKHIKRVSEISALLAKYHPSMTEDDIEVLYHAAPMHDIGKLTVPAEILHKEGSYSENDFEIMKKHANNGYELLRYSDRKLIKAAAIIAHEHHEKWNGKGYPRGLQGEDIHIYGRIIALADVFDALTHSRRYKKAWETVDVVTYIKERSGVQFDPELVDIFIAHLDEFIAIVNPQ
ncbi:HD domain-containing phosphohydrolase [Crenothrix polyspora]|jgi:putative two-component system response regulator|uniref:Response regulator receiver modulated metal dependent phosphohydrolase n=1 Tax=Crenothrix polyspora TaxID=360316 RepID=A0A1R4HHE4_9GAMM|nr:HD domain-containing phosphohydrolase [Crenothrix polyspora]SJM95300.1 Response regulator receiver modulated metal dependent phosphohydrolase [Crenothrix polyspora]